MIARLPSIVSRESPHKAEQALRRVKAVLGFGGVVARLSEVDVSKGVGVVSDKEWCFWTFSRHRVTVSYGGAVIAFCSEQPDPECPA